MNQPNMTTSRTDVVQTHQPPEAVSSPQLHRYPQLVQPQLQQGFWPPMMHFHPLQQDPQHPLHPPFPSHFVPASPHLPHPPQSHHLPVPQFFPQYSQNQLHPPLNAFIQSQHNPNPLQQTQTPSFAYQVHPSRNVHVPNSAAQFQQVGHFQFPPTYSPDPHTMQSLQPIFPHQQQHSARLPNHLLAHQNQPSNPLPHYQPPNQPPNHPPNQPPNQPPNPPPNQPPNQQPNQQPPNYQFNPLQNQFHQQILQIPLQLTQPPQFQHQQCQQYPQQFPLHPQHYTHQERPSSLQQNNFPHSPHSLLHQQLVPQQNQLETPTPPSLVSRVNINNSQAPPETKTSTIASTRSLRSQSSRPPPQSEHSFEDQSKPPKLVKSPKPLKSTTIQPELVTSTTTTLVTNMAPTISPNNYHHPDPFDQDDDFPKKYKKTKRALASIPDKSVLRPIPGPPPITADKIVINNVDTIYSIAFTPLSDIDPDSLEYRQFVTPVLEYWGNRCTTSYSMCRICKQIVPNKSDETHFQAHVNYVLRCNEGELKFCHSCFGAHSIESHFSTNNYHRYVFDSDLNNASRTSKTGLPQKSPELILLQKLLSESFDQKLLIKLLTNDYEDSLVEYIQRQEILVRSATSTRPAPGKPILTAEEVNLEDIETLLQLAFITVASMDIKSTDYITFIKPMIKWVRTPPASVLFCRICKQVVQKYSFQDHFRAHVHYLTRSADHANHCHWCQVAYSHKQHSISSSYHKFQNMQIDSFSAEYPQPTIYEQVQLKELCQLLKTSFDQDLLIKLVTNNYDSLLLAPQPSFTKPNKRSVLSSNAPVSSPLSSSSRTKKTRLNLAIDDDESVQLPPKD